MNLQGNLTLVFMLTYALFTDSSKVVSIESEEQFNDSVRKAEGMLLKHFFAGMFLGKCCT